MSNKILITGSSGFLGSNLQNLLHQYNYQIYAASRTNKIENNNTNLYLNLEDTNSFDSILKNKSIVIHCAGIAHSDSVNEKDYYNINYWPTINLYKKCSKHNVKKFFFISSINVSVNNVSNNNTPINESHVSENYDYYTKYKILAEKKLIQLSLNNSCDLIILRPGLIYGPKVKGNFNLLIKLLNKNIPLPFGNCNNVRDMISVYNFALIIHKLIDKKKLNYQIYNISDGKRLEFLTFLKIIKDKLGKKNYLFFNFPKKFLKALFYILFKKKYYNRLYNSLIINNNRLKNEIDWETHYTIDYGLKKTCDYYMKKNNDL